MVLGERVNALSPRRWRLARSATPQARTEAGTGSRTALMRRPVPVAVAAATLLVVARPAVPRSGSRGSTHRCCPRGRARASSTTALDPDFPATFATPAYAVFHGSARMPRPMRAAVRALPRRAGARAPAHRPAGVGGARLIGQAVSEPPSLRLVSACARCPAARSWAERRRSSSIRSTRSARTSRSPSRCSA